MALSFLIPPPAALRPGCRPSFPVVLVVAEKLNPGEQLVARLALRSLRGEYPTEFLNDHLTGQLTAEVLHGKRTTKGYVPFHDFKISEPGEYVLRFLLAIQFKGQFQFTLLEYIDSTIRVEKEAPVSTLDQVSKVATFFQPQSEENRAARNSVDRLEYQQLLQIIGWLHDITNPHC